MDFQTLISWMVTFKMHLLLVMPGHLDAIKVHNHDDNLSFDNFSPIFTLNALHRTIPLGCSQYDVEME